MDAFAVFGIQNLLSFVVFGLFAWWYVWPWLESLERTTAFTAVTFVHALRPIGATVLAIITLLALRARSGFAIALVWVTNVVGTLDLLNALVGGVRYDIPRLGMGSFWYVVTILVPILWIAHVLAFTLLLRRRT